MKHLIRTFRHLHHVISSYRSQTGLEMPLMAKVKCFILLFQRKDISIYIKD